MNITPDEWSLLDRLRELVKYMDDRDMQIVSVERANEVGVRVLGGVHKDGVTFDVIIVTPGGVRL